MSRPQEAVAGIFGRWTMRYRQHKRRRLAERIMSELPSSLQADVDWHPARPADWR